MNSFIFHEISILAIYSKSKIIEKYVHLIIIKVLNSFKTSVTIVRVYFCNIQIHYEYTNH